MRKPLWVLDIVMPYGIQQVQQQQDMTTCEGMIIVLLLCIVFIRTEFSTNLVDFSISPKIIFLSS